MVVVEIEGGFFMEKLGQVKKGLKLSDTDKRVLLAYAGLNVDTVVKPKIETTVHKNSLKFKLY